MSPHEGAPRPAGPIRIGRPTFDDVPAVKAVMAAMDVRFIGESEVDEDDVRDAFRTLDLQRDAWLVSIGSGAPVGYVDVEDRGDGLVVYDGYVHPDWTGLGIGSRLVDLAEERCRQIDAGRTQDVPLIARTFVLHADRAARELLERRGYERVRSFFRMRIVMEEPPPPASVPEGLTITPFDPGEVAEVHRLLDEVSADEWEPRRVGLDEFIAERLDSPRFDAGLWWVAHAGDEPAGVVISTWKRFEAGWIDNLAVRRRWRRRGLGLALLHTALGGLYRRGQRRCALGVDAANPSGATRLYERAGMDVVWRADGYERPLRGTVQSPQ